ncbi:MAG: VOC family protein [Opitutae bacterium]|nr:VOC family protein [Opitutae bacterium]
MSTTPASPVRISSIAFAGYPVTNVARARAFYEGVLGLKPSLVFGETDGQAWIEYDIGAGTLAIASVGTDKWKPSSNGPMVALDVEDFDATVAHLRAHNVTFVGDLHDFPSCRMASVRDPDGNAITIHFRKSA